MNEQRTPDALSTENELICEKLLGWRRLCHNDVTWWELPSTGEFQPTMLAAHSFTTWAEAGLILDALGSHGVEPTLEYSDGKWDCYGGDPFKSFIHAYRDTGPLAIRAAALEYIRSQP